MGRKKGPLTSFSPVTSTNVGVFPQIFFTFSLKPFCYTGVKPELRPPLKRSGFSSQILKKLRF